MIEINLLPGAKRRRGGKGAGLRLPNFAGMLAAVKDPWLIAAVAVWVLVLAIGAPLYVRRGAQVRSLEPKVDAAKRDSIRFAGILARRRALELRRDSVLGEIKVIRDIDRDRYVWPHVLDAVTKALPQYTWLDDVAARGGEGDSAGSAALSIQGKTADPQAFTRFMRNLEESPFIQGVTAVSTALVNEQNHDVTSFVLNARYQVPPPSLLTMQSLEATVVRGVRSGGGARR